LHQPDFLSVKKQITYRPALLLFFVVLLLAACSTTKNTVVTRTYHNINSRYNGYFYARESMKDAQDKIVKNYIDDYTQLLPIFRLPNTPETQACFADLEKAIKKATTCIEHHAITKKGTKPPEEIAGAVKWIDDCYLVIGNAHYYKGEYMTSLDIYNYIIQKYPTSPIRFDAMMWKARTQIELGNYTDAEALLDLISNNKSLPVRLQGDIKASYAYLYMQTGNYANAIKYLDEAIKLTKDKKTIARYTFILAQLHEQVGNQKDAFAEYGIVIGLHPAYDMLFNAKLNRARLSASDEKNRTAAKKDLQKMLTDAKNTEYKDQIYYTLAQLEMGANNKEGAMNYYRQSVASSMGNNKQKALSYLALGDIYFAETDYQNAQAYYDSTMTVLPKDYAGYKAIDEKHKSLANLVKYINTVSLEDSVQKIAAKYGNDTTKLYAFIDNLIAKKALEDSLQKEKLKQQLIGLNPPSGGGGGNTPQGSWYFYNPSTISFGVNDFTRKWGNRKLEDNWRRANKEQLIIDDNDPGKDSLNGNTTTTKGKPGDKSFARQPYLANIPMTPDLLSKSDDRTADALYNLGTLYKEQMKNIPKSTAAFEELCTRYPKHKYAMAAHFQLYRIYKDQGNTTKANEHKNYICDQDPKGEYCQLINDTNYIAGKLNDKAKLDAYYTETYDSYTKRNYLDVITRCNYADSVYTNKNDHAAQFAYLRAVSLGKTQGTAAMEAELTKIVANYSKDPMREQAQALLDLIHKQNGTSSNTPVDSNKVVGPAYLLNDNVEFQYMVIVDAGKGDLNKFKIGITDYNGQMFASNGLTVTSIPIDNLHTAVLVKKFENKNKALDYYMLLKSKPVIFANLVPGTFQVTVISTENFALFFKDKNPDTYKAFFDKNILKK
jgi:tetratricopeptide (TPR) repeat protein